MSWTIEYARGEALSIIGTQNDNEFNSVEDLAGNLDAS